MSLKHPKKDQPLKWKSHFPKHRRGEFSFQDRIVTDPDVLVGKPVVRGTRLAVAFIIELLAKGWTPEEILENYPQMTFEDIQACLAYAGKVLRTEKIYPLNIKR